MNTLKLTAKDFKNGEYVGKETFESEYQGSVEIEENLGWQRIKRIWCSGSLVVGAGTSIEAGGYIKAGEYIEAGWYIKAGASIEAGGYIEAGGSIKAGGYGITAGLSISCKLSLSAKMRIIAGVSPWRDGNDNSDSLVTCGKLESGTVVGTLVETGLPETPAPIKSSCHGDEPGPFCRKCGQAVNR